MLNIVALRIQWRAKSESQKAAGPTTPSFDTGQTQRLGHAPIYAQALSDATTVVPTMAAPQNIGNRLGAHFPGDFIDRRIHILIGEGRGAR
jgi:hypothetical protein